MNAASSCLTTLSFDPARVESREIHISNVCALFLLFILHQFNICFAFGAFAGRNPIARKVASTRGYLAVDGCAVNASELSECQQ